MQGTYHQQPQQLVNTYHQPEVPNNSQQVHLVQPNITSTKVLRYKICCCCPIGEASTLGFIKGYFGTQKFIFIASILLHVLVAFAYDSSAFTTKENSGSGEIDGFNLKYRVMEKMILAAVSLIGLLFAYYPKMADHSSESISNTQVFCLIFNIIHFLFLVNFIYTIFLVGYFGLSMDIFKSPNLVFVLVLAFLLVGIVIFVLTISQFVAQCDMISAVKSIREDETSKGINVNNISANSS